jgi:hypothetical protein
MCSDCLRSLKLGFDSAGQLATAELGNRPFACFLLSATGPHRPSFAMFLIFASGGRVVSCFRGILSNLIFRLSWLQLGRAVTENGVGLQAGQRGARPLSDRQPAVPFLGSINHTVQGCRPAHLPTAASAPRSASGVRLSPSQGLKTGEKRPHNRALSVRGSPE